MCSSSRVTGQVARTESYLGKSFDFTVAGDSFELRGAKPLYLLDVGGPAPCDEGSVSLPAAVRQPAPADRVLDERIDLFGSGSSFAPIV
jgi:hypothetical protein